MGKLSPLPEPPDKPHKIRLVCQNCGGVIAASVNVMQPGDSLSVGKLKPGAFFKGEFKVGASFGCICGSTLIRLEYVIEPWERGVV